MGTANPTTYYNENGWLLLILSGRRQRMKDRWIKIDKSIGFLKYLLKDGALKNTNAGQNNVSKRVIQDALRGQSPPCEECNGTGRVRSWPDLLTETQGWNECPTCSGTGGTESYEVSYEESYGQKDSDSDSSDSD